MTREPEDRLEKFVIDHRSEFDSEDPPKGIWYYISEEVHGATSHRRKPSILDMIWRVAAVFFFGLTVYFVIDRVSNKNEDISGTLTESIYQEFFNAEKYYIEVIQVKKLEISNKLSQEDPLNADFQEDIIELDSVYNQLKNEFELNNDELVIDAMVHNLRLRIEILDKQLKIIENINNIQSDEDEGITI